MLNFSLFYFIFLTICEIDPRMVRIKGSFFYVKVIFLYIFLYLQASRDWVLLKRINIFGSVYTYRSHWNKEMKSPPATRTTMTTWFHRDVLLMRRPIFGLVYLLKNAPLHIRWFISFEKQAPYYLVLYLELWKQKSKNSVTKGSPPVRKPLADFLTVLDWKLRHFKLKIIICDPL